MALLGFDEVLNIVEYADMGTVMLPQNMMQLVKWCRLEELQVLDIKFLYGCSKPTIAVLYQVYFTFTSFGYMTTCFKLRLG